LFVGPGDYRIAIDYRAEGVDGRVGLLMLTSGEGLQLLSPLPTCPGQKKQVISTVNLSQRAAEKPISAIVFYEGRGRLSVERLLVEKSHAQHR
jgi:hypothetical protein